MGLFYNDTRDGPRNPHGSTIMADKVIDSLAKFDRMIKRLSQAVFTSALCQAFGRQLPSATPQAVIDFGFDIRAEADMKIAV